MFQGYSEKFSLSSDGARRISAISLINIGWCGHILLHSPLFVSQPESAIFMYNFSITYKSLHIAVLKKVRYALCPMPYALCPMPYAQSYLIFLRKAINREFLGAGTLLVLVCAPYSRYLRFVWNAIMVWRSPAESNIPTHIQTFANCCGQLRH